MMRLHEIWKPLENEPALGYWFQADSGMYAWVPSWYGSPDSPGVLAKAEQVIRERL